MLAEVRDFMASDPPPFEPNFTFERTEVWELDYEAAHSLPHDLGNGAGVLLVQDILDELRLTPDAYAQAQREALSRALLIREGRRQKGRAGKSEKESALRSWLGEQKIGLKKALENHRIRDTELDSFLEEEALVRWTSAALDDIARSHLLNALRSHGRLAPLIERAEAKQRVLQAVGKEQSTLETSGIPPAALLGWFWQQAFPGQWQTVAPGVLAEKMGFADVSEMNRALLREYLFRRYGEKHGIAPGRGSLT